MAPVGCEAFMKNGLHICRCVILTPIPELLPRKKITRHGFMDCYKKCCKIPTEENHLCPSWHAEVSASYLFEQTVENFTSCCLMSLNVQLSLKDTASWWEMQTVLRYLTNAILIDFPKASKCPDSQHLYNFNSLSLSQCEVFVC